MPLQRGSSRQTVGANIRKLVHEYDRSGTIGTSHPATRRKAIKQAVAIALDKARKRRRSKATGAGRRGT
jgi:hypothetical protein